MADSDLIPFGAAIAEDVLSALQLPGGATLSAIAQGYVAKKRKEAAEVLIREISSGRHGPVNFDEEDVEPLIDMVLRFWKAVSDGAARENLLLLAQVIAGLKKRRAFDPDRFRRWARIVEALTRDQLLVIGLAARMENAVGIRSGVTTFDQEVWKGVIRAGFTKEETEALLTSVASTGLLSSSSAVSGLAYTPTPWLSELAELAELADLEAAKRAEN